MSAILGIDAAWTDRHPSGVALVQKRERGWHCLALAPSYESFVAIRTGRALDWKHEPLSGSRLQPADLLRQASRLLGGGKVTIVAADLPLAYSAITKRREADDEISRSFGAAWCGTHSPSQDRPGPLSDALRAEFEAEGYGLATKGLVPGTPGHLIEVYPHVALLALMGFSQRAQYKVGKTRTYWPEEPSVAERRHLLIMMHRIMLSFLQKEIDNIDLPLPKPNSSGTLASLKRFEDALDALVCAWVGIKYLEGEAVAYGDEDAAIWVV
jgi:predicted RNase H-like nuclease